MNEPEKWFKGKNLFMTIEWVSSYIILISLMIIIMLGLIDLVWWFGLFLLIFLLAFISTQQYVYRIHSERYAGAEILDSWTDIDFDIGEEFLYPIAKIDFFPDISPSARDAVDKFVDGMGQYYAQLTKTDFKKKVKELDAKIIKESTQKRLEMKEENQTSKPKEKKESKKKK